ncbi:YlxR family protein [Embleya sp. NPDC001921]
MSGRRRPRACPRTTSEKQEITASPCRTCVGCRQRAAKADLLRVVAVEGSCVPDPRGRMLGRGAHLHPDPECLAQAERRKAFVRALRVPGPLDSAPLRAYLSGDGLSEVGRTGPAKQYLASRK